jgi:excisionase family DNA binding protein
MEGQNPTSQDNSQKPKEMIRVSISEAARLFGVNAQTIRRAIASQEITYVIVAGRYKVNFESLVKWSQHHTTVKNKLAKKGIGQFVEKWKIKNPLYSPNPKSISKEPPAKESPAKEKTTS